MAKFEKRLKGNFSDFTSRIHHDITDGSITATYEDGSDISIGDTRVAIRVYERYSMLGKNRVSLNITIIGKGDDLFISAITSGGSQAVFFKINIWGEESFLDQCIKSVQNYISAYRR